ncbi:hypothetical protein NP493_249g11095 [Ridgeia piscesae]|uniref:Uncharacterized protein n=1 Tax=Ridgeia piscesae TaxID=27915 RepID=A0AAD9UD22_RIDPI|nr:hypothetical protein NP493_249g11095 [Ridgeia piscesae]
MNQTIGKMLPAPPAPPPPPLTWDANNGFGSKMINNRHLSLDPHESMTAAAEWTEREHLHNLVNKLTIENIDLKSQRTAKEKLVDSLEKQVKSLESELTALKRRINRQGFPDSSSKESIPMALGCEAHESDSRVQLTAHRKALDWLNPQDEAFDSQVIFSGGSTPGSLSPSSPTQLKGPGVFVQLSTNPWQAEQESNALRDLVNCFISAMTPPSKKSTPNAPTSSSNSSHVLLQLSSFYLSSNGLTHGQPKESLHFLTGVNDQYLIPVELTDVERLTAVLNTRKAIWYGTHADQLVLSASGTDLPTEQVTALPFEVHRTPSGHVCDTDIENMIVTLRHERNKNAALMAALKEMEKQQYNLTHDKREAVFHLDRERLQNKRLTNVITTLKLRRRRSLCASDVGAGPRGRWSGSSNRWLQISIGIIVHMVAMRVINVFFA